MALLTSTNSDALATTEVGQALIQKVGVLSVALQVMDFVGISSTSFSFPVVQADPAAEWLTEGAEFTLSDADIVEETVVPKKVGALSKLSRELVTDNPVSSTLVIGGIARDIARKIDAAAFSTLAAPAPAGLTALLGAIPTANGVDAGAEWSNLDAFEEAISAAEEETANIRAFVANPADALVLAQLKVATGSNQPLLGSDATQPGRRVIRGIPLLVSPYVTVGTVWGVPDEDRVMAVVRQDTEVVTDNSVYFTSDSVALRGTARVAYAVGHPAAVQAVQLSAG